MSTTYIIISWLLSSLFCFVALLLFFYFCFGLFLLWHLWQQIVIDFVKVRHFVWNVILRIYYIYLQLKTKIKPSLSHFNKIHRELSNRGTKQSDSCTILGCHTEKIKYPLLSVKDGHKNSSNKRCLSRLRCNSVKFWWYFAKGIRNSLL